MWVLGPLQEHQVLLNAEHLCSPEVLIFLSDSPTAPDVVQREALASHTLCVDRPMSYEGPLDFLESSNQHINTWF